jgi:hypothetical protein
MLKSIFLSFFLQIQTLLLLRFGLIYCIDYIIFLFKNFLLVIVVDDVVPVLYHLDDPHTTYFKISFNRIFTLISLYNFIRLSDYDIFSEEFNLTLLYIRVFKGHLTCP